LGKFQERRNQNNQNAQWISIESRDDGKNINIVTRGGSKTCFDATKQDPTQHQWVKNNTEPHKYFDAQKENETFKEFKQEFPKKNVVSTLASHTQKTLLCTICLPQWTIKVQHNL